MTVLKRKIQRVHVWKTKHKQDDHQTFLAKWSTLRKNSLSYIIQGMDIQ